MTKTVAVMATLDTKGEEVKYFKKQFGKRGIKTFVMDTGLRGTPHGVQADVTRECFAEVSDSTVDKLAAMGRGEAIEVMVKGISKVVKELYGQGCFQGIMAIGGLDGALLTAGAMRTLPLGVPKLLLTPVAQGKQQFGPFVGTTDMVVMHSVIDILGVNQISRKIFDTAVGAMAGMLRMNVSTKIEGKNVVAMTMYGNTTPTAELAKKLFEERGYEVVIFHPNGTGGMSMEEMIDQRLFSGVFDLTTHEITDWLYNGLHAGGPTRLDAGARAGVPQVIVPGCVDFVLMGPVEKLEPEFKKRKTYNFNPAVSLVSTTKEEMEHIASIMAKKLNKAKGPLIVLIPLRGFSMYCHPGEALYDPERDAAFINTFKKTILPNVRVIEVDAHINDPVFADRAVAELIGIIENH